VKVPDEEGRANHLGSESCAGVGNGGGEALTGGGAGRAWSPAIGQFGCRRAPPTRKATAGTPLRRGGPAPGGVEDPRQAQRPVARASGAPPSGPGRWWGPHGEPTGYDREGRTRDVGQPQSLGEAPEQRCWCARTGGGGGEKGAGPGEREGAHPGPDTAPGTPVPCARLRTAGTFGCLRVITQGRSPVQECRAPGSVRGVLGNQHPYHDPSSRWYPEMAAWYNPVHECLGVS
jgi:hypothetical protein